MKSTQGIPIYLKILKDYKKMEKQVNSPHQHEDKKE
jgi:hypothetical protein